MSKKDTFPQYQLPIPAREDAIKEVKRLLDELNDAMAYAYSQGARLIYDGDEEMPFPCLNLYRKME